MKEPSSALGNTTSRNCTVSLIMATAAVTKCFQRNIIAAETV